jgi:hypothetical protein
MVGNANRLGISCPTNEGISWGAYTSNFVAPVVAWLSNNPTLRPQYVILFQDFPSRFTNANGGTESVQFDLNAGYNPYFSTIDYATNWTPFVTSINMNGTGGASDCTNYINKLTNMAGNSQKLFISARAANYGNSNWYFDDANAIHPYSAALFGVEGVETNGVPTNNITYTPLSDTTNITRGTNVAGYCTWGVNGGLPADYAISNVVSFSASSTWYIIATVESFNGQRVTGQGNFLEWFSTGAFGSTNYTNTPVGAISHVDEPHEYADNTYNYFGLWSAGKSFAVCAWAGQIGTYSENGYSAGYSDFWFQATGDPFVNR